MEVNDRLIPYAVGAEHENAIGIKTQKGDFSPDIGNIMENIRALIPDDLKYSIGNRIYLSNGGALGDGGSDDGTPTIEYGTPEVVLPSELYTATAAMDSIIDEIISNYFRLHEPGIAMDIRRHVRNAFYGGVRKATHDNLTWNDETIEREKDPRRGILLAHLATMQVFAGAGYVGPNGLELSQKNGGLQQIAGHNYYGTMLRGYDLSSIGSHGRIEIRNMDQNISPWATQLRIGSTALLLATLKVPELVDKLIDINPITSPIEQAKRISRFDLEDGFIKSNPDIIYAIDYQERLAEMYLERLISYSEINDEYLIIAYEILQYLRELKEALMNGGSFETFKDRSDYAAKLAHIISSLGEGGLSEHGSKDMEAEKLDMKYDFVRYRGLSGSQPTITLGYGHKLVQEGQFRLSTSASQVRKATRKPLSKTRARIRADFIRRFGNEGNVRDWDEIEFDHDGDPAPYTLLFSVDETDLGKVFKDPNNIR